MYCSIVKKSYWELLVQYILGFVFLCASSFSFSTTVFTYYLDGDDIEIRGCVELCPSNLVIPEMIDGYKVRSIGVSAFKDNSLTSIFIPNTVIEIHRSAFQGNQLTTLILPNGISTIEHSAFSNNSLKAVVFPTNVEHIEDSAFENNELSAIDIPGKTRTIGWRAFKGNEILNITIPSSIETIGGRAFFQNPLESVNFLGDRPTFGKESFALKEEIYYSNEFTDDDWSLCVDEDINGNGLLDPGEDVNGDGQLPDYPECIYERAFWEVVSLSTESSVDVTYQKNKSGWPGDRVFIDNYSWGTWCDSYFYCTDNVVSAFSTPQISPIVFPSVFDIDQNGSFDALTDGLVILRYAFGFRGDSLINSAIASDGTRTSAADIEAYIESHMP